MRRLFYFCRSTLHASRLQFQRGRFTILLRYNISFKGE
ncbi:hypothetical protein BN135_3470 [Cronobacter muytjensii 530]